MIAEKGIDRRAEESTQNIPKKRQTLSDIVGIRQVVLQECERMLQHDRNVSKLMEEIDGHSFYSLRFTGQAHGPKNIEKEFDRYAWRYLVDFYQLKKYMLCTDYEKMKHSIEGYDFPEFTEENAQGWLDNLKHIVHESVQKLVQEVFTKITDGTYTTGSSYSTRKKKKRNNAGIDKHFILSTSDNYSMSWYGRGPTITDDLEKACYILDGKQLPETTIKETMRNEKTEYGENAYFRMRACKNGNTHYWMKDEIRSRLNYYGARRGVIGEGVKIKIFDKEF